MQALISHTLHCHATQQTSAVEAIKVTVDAAADGTLRLCYRVYARPAALLLPEPQTPGPADNLWQHTCCELFVAAQETNPTVNRKNYLEFNFSPSGQWAAYAFTDYRERDTAFAANAVPRLSLHRLADGFQLDAVLPPELLPAESGLQLGLSAVIEDAAGKKTYWALQHCAAQPDFHLRPSFALPLNRPTP